MLRKKKDSLKDIPKEARHSLQFLDDLLNEFDDEKGGTPAQTLRNTKKVPPDARKSLQILDDVLDEFDIGTVKPRRSESVDNIRITPDVTEEVQKSIEILDTVLDEFQKEVGREIFPRKPKIRGNESLQRSRHEDVRRSLEVLDSVLAEFDDCLENWDNTVHDIRPPENNSWAQKDKETNADANSFISYDSQTTDGSTSHDSGLSLQEQVKVTSPPPVPKRSATTKLSDRNSGLFTFSDIYSFDSLSSDSAFQDNATNLSTNGAITTLSAKNGGDEVFKYKNNNTKVDFCVNCGSEIGIKSAVMEKKSEKDPSSSPFLERRKMFEDRMDETKINVSPLLARSFTGSSFKARTNVTKECESEPTSLIFYKTSESDRSEVIHSNFAAKYSPKATKVDPPRIDGLLSLPSNLLHAPNCNCKERLRQLQIKFAETRRLLKANKIRGIDARPPSFVPPPPPSEATTKNSRNISFNSDKQLSNELSENGRMSDSNSYSASNGSLNSESFSSEISDVSHPSPVPESEKIPNISNSDEQKLCNRCSTVEPPPIAETIEDIPKLRPTDALKRPYLGFSLCMEEDFIPDVKEILQTSTPRNGTPLSKNKLTASLSTFSLSDSSLGYVSSQSDLEISSSSIKGEKVPLSSLKCNTLPEGMDLHSLPSYYGHGDRREKSSQPLYRDRNFNHTTDPQLMKSVSNSPMPEAVQEKPKKKHFRGFSRKDKDKKKNGELSIELAGRREIC